MNIYLDIDKTILKNDGAPAEGLKEFLEYLLANHTVYWLTSHCRGALEHLEVYLDRYVEDKNLLELMSQIKPTTWDTLKTEAIDFTQPFLWLDDYILEVEKKELERRNALSSWIQIDLANNPNHLLDVAKFLQPTSAKASSNA